jgi:hypothetical protein
MAHILVTYDLKKTDPAPHRVFIEEAEKQDLLYVHQVDSGKLVRLPNTTLWGSFDDAAAARAAFDKAVKAAEKRLGIKIKLERRVITPFAEGFLISDKKKSPTDKWKKATPLETCRAHQLNDPYFAY